MKFLTFDETREIPYYKHNPRLSKLAWIVLILCLPASFLIYSVMSIFGEFISSICFCLVLLIPLLYFSNWDWKLLFHKPTKNEIILALLMFAGYMIYSLIMGEFLSYFSLAGADASSMYNVNVELIVSLIFSMMAEELIKFIPLVFFMRLFFKFSDNYKLSLVLSSIIVLIGFGLIHYTPDNTLASVLLLQGLGTIFELYGYIKTKNILVSYMSHLFTDAFLFTLILFGF